MTEILDKILVTTTGAAMLADVNRSHREQRAAIANALGRHIIDAERKGQPLAATEAKAAEEVRKAQEALYAAKDALRTAHWESQKHAQWADGTRERHERALLETAGPELTTFLGRIGAEIDRLRDHRRSIVEHREFKELPSEGVGDSIFKLCIEDNTEEIAARLHALADVGQTATRLASTKADYASDLRKLLINLPGGDVR